MADVVRASSAVAVARLQQLGLRVLMLTGDTAASAAAVARQVGITDFFANALPADKAAKVAELQAEGYIVAMVGDGLNDAPALARADVGMAVATSADLAVAAAGITLLRGEVAGVAEAFELSNRTMRVIRQNLFFCLYLQCLGHSGGGGGAVSTHRHAALADAGSGSYGTLVGVGTGQLAAAARVSTGSFCEYRDPPDFPTPTGATALSLQALVGPGCALATLALTPFIG